MPELPEVETIVRRLQVMLPAQRFTSLQVLHPKSFLGDQRLLVGRQIQLVSRRAKIICFHLDRDLVLLTHLKMSGQFVYVAGDQSRVGGGHPTADWVQKLPSKHTRVQFGLDSGATLFFNDQRIFGWIKVLSVTRAEQELEKLGPDIIDPIVTPLWFWQVCQRKSAPIKVLLMDSQVVAGVGNMYACDALNMAHISPWRSAESLSLAEATNLLECSRVVIERAIALGGTNSDGKYVQIDGFAGGYQNELRTYDREGQPCLDCRTLLRKEKLAGRGTYFCPHCQV